MLEIRWEVIFIEGGKSGNTTYRARVYGGWLVNSRSWDNCSDNLVATESMTFVPDPDHLWGTKYDTT